MKPNSTHSHKKSIGKKCLTFTVIYDMVKVWRNCVLRTVLPQS